MKKLLTGLVVASLILLGTACFADTTLTGAMESPGVKVPELSLSMAATDVKTAIEVQPVSLLDYFDFSIDFLSTLLARLAKTAQPMYLFNGQVAAGVSIFELAGFDVVWGLSQSGNQFYGLEVKGLPLGGAIGQIFKKVHPIAIYYTGNGGYFTAGICYEFRSE